MLAIFRRPAVTVSGFLMCKHVVYSKRTKPEIRLFLHFYARGIPYD